MSPGETHTVRKVLRDYALQEDGDEQGAQTHRFRVVSIDRSRGTAAGYVAKYVAKNIDGYGLETDSHGRDAARVARRVETWASVWGIRQFQQLGGPPVGVWRELRRISVDSVSGLMLDAVRAAGAGDWASFTELMNGPTAKRAEHPISPFKVWSDKLGRYDDPVGWRIFGVQLDTVVAVSRIHTWSIRPREKESGPEVLDHGVGGCGSGSSGSPGSRAARPRRVAATTTTTRGPRVKDLGSAREG